MKLENFKKYSLAVAIMIVLALFVNVGVNTFYKAPENPCFEEFREPIQFRFCEGLEGDERQECFNESQKINQKINEDQKKCHDEFRPIQQLYNRNVFIFLLIVGLITIFIGLYLGATTVSSGLILGGILNIVIGVMRYWSDMEEFLRFTILGIALIILIYVGYKKIK